MDTWSCALTGAVIALVMLILYSQYMTSMGSEGFGFPRYMVFYPPHVRVTRTGLKYYDKPYSHLLRRQLNVPILPPAVAAQVNAAPGMGAVPLTMPPPPSQEQVYAFPNNSGAIFAPGPQGEPVSVKIGKA